MSELRGPAPPQPDPLLEVVSRQWGFSELKPLQREAMEAVLAGRDSLLVVPTGGGKSLCYQAPALLTDRPTVVVSPLISLMKDQVDALRENGIAAAQLNSSQSSLERRAIERDLEEGSIRLLFVSPERMAVPSFRELLRRAGVGAFAIDEAHCISHWGHDFRPEYRQLRELRELFPDASVHAYTATATGKVRGDIVAQLALRDPLVLVGEMDRPNLVYRILPRRDELIQVEEVLERHRDEAGIVYCIRRRDVDELTAELVRSGHRAVAYHAGLTQDERRAAQDAFTAEACEVVVATVAFGMGIDRSNVRFVIHTGMPKSIEHYQQETGRAGRDGLEAECVLLYSGGDTATWRSILQAGAAPGTPRDHVDAALRLVERMDRFCSASVCRHRALVEHFGGTYDAASCRACDVCLDDLEELPDALTIAQKILSCVVRTGQTFGTGHVISVLRGEAVEKVRARGHDRLSTFGLLRDSPREEIRDWIAQLLAQRVLALEGDRYPILRLTESSRPVLRGETPVRLLRPRAVPARRKRGGGDDWAGVDRALFETLREWRREQASRRGVPPFVIFGDRTLRGLAAARPSTRERLRAVSGVGDAKLAEYGEAVLAIVRAHCATTGASLDAPSTEEAGRPSRRRRRPGRSRNSARERAIELLRTGAPVDAVAEQTGRARSTVSGYLCELVEKGSINSVDPWVSSERYRAIAAASADLHSPRLAAVRERLGESFAYDEIRLVLTHLQANAPASPPEE
ncbi:MAG TPA: DNA helicase RecQ [Thermoanaerobaculia bacterium]|nr:DNA helicase RecQ [Thermoanaerobaculia bacterium]